jgi:peptide/nickel transport system ATP-binding protein
MASPPSQVRERTEFALEVEGLTCAIQTPQGPIPLLSDVSFKIPRGETLGIVGESGSGKTMLARAIMGITPNGAELTGRILLDGVDLLSLPLKERRQRLGVGIGMVFQNPMTSLNPVVPIGRQITEGLRHHRSAGRKEAKARAMALLDQVGLSDQASRLSQYPHQLSGGMRQRVMIASALACDPEILIADEATTALDVTVQKQILDLIGEIQAARHMSVILVSHDMGVVSGRTDELVVMYTGKIVEAGPTDALFERHRHQYTSALLRSIPSLDGVAHSRLTTIPGSAPHVPPGGFVGCSFAPRCSAATDICGSEEPTRSFDAGSSHWFRCHWPREAGIDLGDVAARHPVREGTL